MKKKTFLCYSFMTSYLQEVYQEITTLQSRSPNMIFIAGGPHATGNPQEILKMGFDMVFAGDGEITFPEFMLKCLENPRQIEKGIIYGEPVSLDKSFPVSNQFSMIPPLEITRGCFYHCTFCQTGF